MRFERLELIRYGKFTDLPIEFPQAERDFHFVVGPNEAGKSTVRNAMLDLLYSIPRKTPLSFVHPMSEMRLGGKIAHSGQVLEFHRIKRNTQTLRDLAESPMPDGSLGPFLGTTDREFFAQMFGLDHERLVAGGHSILSASDDLGRILFQSAAGIADLGAVREALDAEAERLWSKRRSGDRLYYIASDELDDATATLKVTTVKTKDWIEAQSKLTELEGAYSASKERHASVKARRSLLERVRRIAPHLAALDEANAQLKSLGSVPELPETAAKTLSEAKISIAAAQADIDHQSASARDAQKAMKALVVNDRIRDSSVEITELDEQRLQYRAYEVQMEKRKAEIKAQWDIVVELASSLGWNASSEEAVRTSMPSPAIRATLSRLARDHASVRQAMESARRSAKAKQSDIAAIRAELERLKIVGVPPGLQVALTRAQKLGDFEATIEGRRQAVQKQKKAVERACALLGNWRLEIEPLAAMSPPSTDVIKALVRDQLADDAQQRALTGRLQSLKSEVRQGRLDVAQYRKAHESVSQDEVLNARQARQISWTRIKATPDSLLERAGEFEGLIVQADELADRRHETAKEATELRSKQSHVERLEHGLEALSEELETLDAATAARAENWAALASQCGLPSIPFASAVQWLDARKAVLDANDALSERMQEQELAEQACALARSNLMDELVGVGIQAGDEPLESLIAQAEQLLSNAADSRGQRRSKQEQLLVADGDREKLSDEVAASEQNVETWQRKWSEVLVQAGLKTLTEIEAVEFALDVIGKIDFALASMRKTKLERLDKMREDLEAHAKAAVALAERVAPDLAAETASNIAIELQSRLAAANAAHQEYARQQTALLSAQQKLEVASSNLSQAQATLVPLLERSGVSIIVDLAESVARSDRQRQLRAACASSEESIRNNGDGLSLAQLRMEADTVDPSLLLGELGELTEQDERLVNEVADTYAQQQAASNALHSIGGGPDAAIAEGRRQQALASMADVVERYVKVFTAARLLKWAIEQYREAKQGPMLSLASGIFSRLTLGSFDKLIVDADSDPLKLLGRRPNGAVVEIEGMSEGTRDQLYLALRLAALDMHLEQAHVLPFIADDLFINFDDQRSMAGFAALGELSRKTQVVFLTHHDHLLPTVRKVFGDDVNVVQL